MEWGNNMNPENVVRSIYSGVKGSIDNYNELNKKRTQNFKAAGYDRADQATAEMGAPFVAMRTAPEEIVRAIHAPQIVQKAVSMMGPSDQAKQDAEMVLRGEAPANLNTMREASITPMMGLSKGISPNVYQVHPDDQAIMEDFAHKVMIEGKGRDNLGQLGVDAQRLAEHYLGKNWSVVSNDKMAKGFAWVLDNLRGVPQEAMTAIGRIPH